MPPQLKKFEGRPVTAVKAAITGAGDGLSKAMAIEPREHRSGDEVMVVMKCKVGKIGHVPGDESADTFERVEQFKAKIVTIVDEDLVKAVIDEQYERNVQYDAERKGQLSFPAPEGGEEVEPSGNPE